MIMSGPRILPALGLAASAMLAGCGSDSTGPGSIDRNGALQSLALGLQTMGGVPTPSAPDFGTSFGGIAPLLGEVDVTVDGSPQRMFGFGLRETFPAGTCEETLFVDPSFPPPQGVCTPPPLGVVLILWQSHAANAPPDKLLFIVAEPGTSDFSFASTNGVVVLPAFALYMQDQDNVWSSLSGSLTSTVTGINEPCSLPLPPYAKKGDCSFAAFDEQGQIVFEPFTFDQPNTRRLTIALPRQTLHGLWLAISEVQPVTFPLTAVRTIPDWLAPTLGRLAPRVTRAR
jgi:hypothetical protein